MRLLLTSEARLERAPDGTIWAPPAYGHGLWSRYLAVFSSVTLAARVKDVAHPSAGCIVASGPGVEFCALPPYSGTSGLLRNMRSVQRAIRLALPRCPAVIVRAPSPVAYLLSQMALGARQPYGAEIVGDPDEVFAPGAFRHPLRAPLRRFATLAQKRLSRRATAAMFVTTKALQRKYPTAGRAYAASDVALDDGAFDVDRSSRRVTEPFTLISVAGLDQPYKGTSILLNALGELRQRGTPVRLRIVGSGTLMADLQRQARDLNVLADVEFLGQLDRDGVRKALDSADLFVHPSLTEGLPRALLEAMARGLPAVASAVGGVPELLSPECLVPARDWSALAGLIHRLTAEPRLLDSLGKRNREAARAHHDRIQEPVRKAFLLDVRQACAAGCRKAACA
jgi:glycosyltransferase involved in cell wall biosynthesis